MEYPKNPISGWNNYSKKLIKCSFLNLLLVLQICPAMENQIMGVPEIECGENAVTFTVKTKSAFRLVFVY